MTLYQLAGPDGKEVGSCPFAHFVRLVLEEKGLEYELKPTVQATKPAWLIEHYDGKMPALRHGKECVVESDVIAEYLDFVLEDPRLKASSEVMEEAEEAIAGYLPAMATYFRHTADGDEVDAELRAALEERLAAIEGHLTRDGRAGPYMVGDGSQLTLVDCGLAPKLYHLQTGLEAFKSNAIDIPGKFPALQAYMDTVFARESFQATAYPKSTAVWGWSTMRGK